MTTKNIAVLQGGYSKESEVSQKTAANIMNALDRERYTPYLITIEVAKWYHSANGKNIIVDKNDFSITIDNKKITFEYIFFAIHGTPAEDGLLQGYFDMLQLPYSASNAMASALSFNKFAYNNFIKSFNVVHIAKSVLISNNDTIDVTKILDTTGLPCFVKPNQQGSSLGISKVETAEELIPAIKKALVQDDYVIVEEFLMGTEVTNGCMKIGNIIEALPITEVVSKNKLFDFEAKYDPKLADEITPARISDELTQKVQNITKQIYKISKFAGIIRIDYIIKDDGIYMLEANTIPGMTSNSFIPKQLASINKNLSDVLTELIG